MSKKPENKYTGAFGMIPHMFCLPIEVEWMVDSHSHDDDKIFCRRTFWLKEHQLKDLKENAPYIFAQLTFDSPQADVAIKELKFKGGGNKFMAKNVILFGGR